MQPLTKVTQNLFFTFFDNFSDDGWRLTDTVELVQQIVVFFFAGFLKLARKRGCGAEALTENPRQYGGDPCSGCIAGKNEGL
jgi:hypothetical protein